MTRTLFVYRLRGQDEMEWCLPPSQAAFWRSLVSGNTWLARTTPLEVAKANGYRIHHIEEWTDPAEVTSDLTVVEGL